MEHFSLVLDAADAGERLDRCLESKLERLTRSRIKRLIQEGRVTMDGARAKAGYVVKGGEVLAIDIPDPPAIIPLPERIPIEVIYEDETLAVVDKPPGMAVHPGAGRISGTLVSALLGRGMRLSSIGSPLRPGIVHRLDKDTSGLLVVAKTDPAHLRLSRDLAERAVERLYWTITWGVPREARGEIDAPLGRSPADRRKMHVRERGGKTARTAYRVVWTGGFCSVLHLKLHTGRTHQIRVHLKHLGNPVFGDPDYGGRGRRAEGLRLSDRTRARAALDRLPRQALHAMQLAFNHPATGEALCFRSSPGPDICGAAEELQVPSEILDPGFLEE